MTDQHRWDCIGINGNKVIKTPNLDYLGENGVLIDNAYVQNPVCVPSRCTLFTGRYPQAHLARDLNKPLDRKEVNLFDLLKADGYTLGLSGKNHFLDKERLNNTFDSIFEVDHTKTKKELKSYSYSADADPSSLDEYNSVRVKNHAIDFIRENSENPFALLVSFGDPHTPYSVPEPYASMYEPDALEEPVFDEESLKDKPVGVQLLRQLLGMDTASQNDIMKMRSIYYGMISLVDDCIGEILGTLEKLNIEDDTLIVFTADHGEYLGDFGLCRKSYNFYDCLVHVPLIFYQKGRLKPRRITDTMVESTDILPTILDYLNIDEPEGVQGKSLRENIDEKCSIHREYVFSTAGYPHDCMAVNSIKEWESMTAKPKLFPYWKVGSCNGNMIRTMEWKLCYYNTGEGELYDMENDPYEQKNLYKDENYNDVKNNMMELLIKALMNCQDPLGPSGNYRFK